ncbi:helix-turn-helix domain-containing protein [Kitasatospora sp. NPDC049285]|uniref:helix-turn-helix domain-containing protein n=1 Tax=Kitasatospora sp. NPDC049285 TaxID=3157096 RepID=UPI003449ACE4
MDTAELLLHPVRLRVVHALSGGRELTTGELSARLPDVPKVSVYRHVALLAEAGFLEVAQERRVRNVVERQYRLRRDRPTIDGEAAAAMSVDDHRRGFAAAMAVLIAEFNAYLDRADANPTADSVSYRQGTLWLDPDELAELLGELLAVVQPRLAHRPGPGRVPYLLSPVFFPADPRPAEHGPSARDTEPSSPPEVG